MNEKLEVVRGGVNPFRDVGLSSPDTKLMKADLAAAIIGELRKKHLSSAQAAKRAGVQETDISRIRNADLARFRIDHLVKILNALGQKVEVKVTPRELEPA